MRPPRRSWCFREERGACRVWGPPSHLHCLQLRRTAALLCPYSWLRLLVIMLSEVSGQGRGVGGWGGVGMGMCKIWSSPGALGPVGETRLSAKYLREQCKAGQLPGGWRVRKASWVAKLAGPRRLVEFGLMFETAKSFWLRALPPASLSRHLESSVFEKTHLWSTPPGGGPVVAPSCLSSFHQPLPLPEPGFPVHGITVWPSHPSLLTGLVHPLRPWHPLFLLSGRPFSSLSTW